jgi:hypothetical protein
MNNHSANNWLFAVPGVLLERFFIGTRYRVSGSESKKIDYDYDHPPSPMLWRTGRFAEHEHEICYPSNFLSELRAFAALCDAFFFILCVLGVLCERLFIVIRYRYRVSEESTTTTMTMTSTVRADALTELEHDLVLRLCVMHTERLSGSLSISGIGIEENRLRLRSPLR